MNDYTRAADMAATLTRAGAFWTTASSGPGSWCGCSEPWPLATR